MIEKELPRKKRGISRREIKKYAYTLVGVLSLVGAVISYLRHEIVTASILFTIGVSIMFIGVLD